MLKARMFLICLRLASVNAVELALTTPRALRPRACSLKHTPLISPCSSTREQRDTAESLLTSPRLAPFVSPYTPGYLLAC